VFRPFYIVRLPVQVNLSLYKFYMWGNSRSWREDVGSGEGGVDDPATLVVSKFVTLTDRGGLMTVSCADANFRL
jgi:hypothetical protein